jgi:peptidoglycan/LPS O-acetylase OafA/YrhL
MPEIRPLTGLRGVAAITVFLVHMRETLAERGLATEVPDWAVRLFLNGGRQVDIFFVLSGFILTMNYRSWFTGGVGWRAYLGFMRRRLARIYPLHFFMLVMVIAFVLAAAATGAATRNGLDRFRWSELPAHFLLVHAWGPFIDGPGQWNTPSWSISIETLAYLLFPLSTWLASKWLGARPWPLIALNLIAGFALNAITPWGLDGFPGVARGLSEFMLGCWIFALIDAPIGNWLRSAPGSVFAALALLLCFLSTPDTGFIISVGAAPLLLSLCGKNPASSFFAWKPIYFLGEISYSIYLGHFLLSSIAYRLVSVTWMKTGAGAAVAGTLLIVAFVLAVSTLLYYGIERPGRDLLSGRRREKAAA